MSKTVIFKDSDGDRLQVEPDGDYILFGTYPDETSPYPSRRVILTRAALYRLRAMIDGVLDSDDEEEQTTWIETGG